MNVFGINGIIIATELKLSWFYTCIISHLFTGMNNMLAYLNSQLQIVSHLVTNRTVRNTFNKA